jgi:hypothetical protein
VNAATIAQAPTKRSITRVLPMNRAVQARFRFARVPNHRGVLVEAIV